MSDPVARLNAALEGRYAIERELGEGGMATVYLADDLKHERKVALKVLKPELAAVVGAERFLAEIKTTANLQHPHILPLHDSGEADGFLFYVMPYVEGETLRDRIDREKQLPVDEAVALASKIAGALHHAHEHGVIHRDIKPGNILLQDGEPVVADFGIALAVGAAGSNRLTETGLSLGTPYYMSPEQATGDQAVGASTDTYALGSVLYEMLVGDPPFAGSTAQAVLGKIIAGKHISATEERPSVPANVDAALRCALEKLPADRFTSAQDFVRALADPGFRHGETMEALAGAQAGPWNRLAVAMAALAAVFGAVAGWSLLRPEASQVVQRYSLALEEFSGPRVFDVSRDGLTMVFRQQNASGQFLLWLRRWESLTATPIPGTVGGSNPVISPDGEEVAFIAQGELKVTPLRGGVERLLAGSAVCCPRWGPDGYVYYSPIGRGVSRVPAAGGAVEEVTTRGQAEGAHGWFEVLPGGDVAVFSMWGGQPRIEAMRLSTGERTVLTPGLKPYVMPTGHLVFASVDGQILAASFDPDAMELGTPVPIVEGIMFTTNQSPLFSVSQTGTLVYWSGQSDTELTPVWVDRAGRVQEIDPTWSVVGTPLTASLALSPNGDRLALSIQDPGGTTDLQVKQLDTGPQQRLTFEGAINRRPTWSPDGRFVTFLSNRADQYDIWTKRADASGDARLVLDWEQPINEVLYSPDGQWLIFRDAPDDIYGVPLAGDSVPVGLVTTEFSERYITLSPNGRWLAYVSDAGGREEVYVVPFPDAGSALTIVSTNGGTEPLWAHSGDELFYRNEANQLVAVEVNADASFEVVQEEVLFSMADYLSADGYREYDVSPDDQRFVMFRTGEQGAVELIVVQNWLEELEARVPN